MDEKYNGLLEMLKVPAMLPSAPGRVVNVNAPSTTGMAPGISWNIGSEVVLNTDVVLPKELTKQLEDLTTQLTEAKERIDSLEKDALEMSELRRRLGDLELELKLRV